MRRDLEPRVLHPDAADASAVRLDVEPDFRRADVADASAMRRDPPTPSTRTPFGRPPDTGLTEISLGEIAGLTDPRPHLPLFSSLSLF